MVKQRTKTFMYAEKGKPSSANVFINLSASCVCCSRKKFYRKIFLKASLRGVLISEVLLTASCCIFSARFSEWSILRSCRVSCICYNCSTAALSEELDFKINSTARYCETTIHWLPKYRNMLQYSISTDSWQQHGYTGSRTKLVKLLTIFLKPLGKGQVDFPPSLPSPFLHPAAWGMFIPPTSLQRVTHLKT